MIAYTVDASVAAKWFFTEVHTEQAIKLLSEGYELLAPDLIYPEVANIIWKKHRHNDVDLDGAKAAIQEFKRIPIEIIRHQNVFGSAFEIAVAFDRTVYDALYLATAVYSGSLFVTADRKFFNAMKDSEFSDSIVWVEALN